MTAVIQDLAKVSFHEATLVGISRKGSNIELALDEVLITGARKSVSVTIAGVRGIRRNGSPLEDFSMEEKDGEILTLRADGDGVLLVVEWNNFSTRQQQTAVYSLIGGKIRLDRAPPETR